MSDYNDDLDPLAQMFREIREDRQHRSDEHTALRASDAYQGAIRQVDRYIFDYVRISRISGGDFTRLWARVSRHCGQPFRGSGRL